MDVRFGQHFHKSVWVKIFDLWKPLINCHCDTVASNSDSLALSLKLFKIRFLRATHIEETGGVVNNFHIVHQGNVRDL